MKIFCIGRNYVDHVSELNNEIPTAPVVFMKPPTALLTDNKPFYYPNFTQDFIMNVKSYCEYAKMEKRYKKNLPIPIMMQLP
jgi:acylpyruvate hydrolase